MRFLALNVTANKATSSVVDERDLNPRPMAWSPVVTAATDSYSTIAQLVEQLTFNQRVAGSSPAGGILYGRIA